MTAGGDQGLLGFTSDAPPAMPAGGMDPMSMTGGADPMSFMGGEAAPAPVTDTSPSAMAPPAVPAAAPAGGFEDPFAGMPNSSGGMGKPMPNRTPLREWQDKHEQELEEITAKETASKQAARAAAAEELEKWYSE